MIYEYKDLQIGFTFDVSVLCTDQNSGADKNISFGRLQSSGNWSLLGDVAKEIINYDGFGDDFVGYMVQDNPSKRPAGQTQPAIQQPTGFNQIWADNGIGDDVNNIYFWEMEAPTGYSSLGVVVTSKPEMPDCAGWACVRNDLVEQGTADEYLWSTRGSSADQPISIFSIKPTNSGAESAAEPVNGCPLSSVSIFSPGTFVAYKQEVVTNVPLDNKKLCLKVSSPVKVFPAPASNPSTQQPSTAYTIATMALPCMLVTKDGLNAAQRTAYQYTCKLQEQILWDQGMPDIQNNGATTMTSGYSITTETTTESTFTWGMDQEITFTQGEKTLIDLFEASTSFAISLKFHEQWSKTKTRTRKTTTELDLTILPHQTGYIHPVIWTYNIYRQENPSDLPTLICSYTPPGPQRYVTSGGDKLAN